MKDDLISRSALIEALELAKTYQPVNPVALDLTISVVKAAPAVDAEDVFKHLHWVKEALEMAKQSLAPVVRCKDCKHKRERNEHERNYLAEAVLICTSQDATDDCWNPVWPDHFCSYGERRTDE